MKARAQILEDASGFTLIELLVSLSVMALLTIALGVALQFGLTSWRTTQASIEALDDLTQTREFLRAELASVYPYFTSDGLATARLDFTGTPTSLAFIGSSPKALSIAGRARVSLEVRSDGASQDLVVAAKPELAVFGTAPEPVLSRLVALSFAYYGALNRADPAWHERWDDETRLPDLIRIRAAFADGRTWPELIVAPKIAADVGCRLDPLTHDCRGRQ